MDQPKTLAEWMTNRGIDLQGLVAASGLDAKVVEAIVAGRYTTSPLQRQKVAGALRVAPGDVRWGQAVEVDHLYGHGPQFGRSP